MTTDLAAIRIDYKQRKLDETSLLADPLDQFRVWMDNAIEGKVNEPTAMTLATVGEDGAPHARIVLLKGLDAGFTFFSNYRSSKGKELDQQPRAALVFFWPELERQVRVEGIVHKVSAEESDAYFASRPVSSQIGAIASQQSQILPSRNVLEDAVEHLTKTYRPSEGSRPPYWGGYCLVPTSIEFWQGRSSRLHDRLRYRLRTDKWIIERLSP